MAAAVPTVAELQALITQLQAQVQALEEAAAPAAAAANPAPPVVVFADTPQTLNAEDLIDYSSKRGMEIYKQGIAPLDDKSLTDGFNMTPGETVVFTKAFLSHATAMGWNGTRDPNKSPPSTTALVYPSTSSKVMAKSTKPLSRPHVRDFASQVGLILSLVQNKTTR